MNMYDGNTARNTSYRAKREAKKADRKRRRLTEGLAPHALAASAIGGEDPLLKVSRLSKFKPGKALMVAIGALVAHVAVIGMFFAASAIAEKLGLHDVGEKIAVAVVERKIEPPPPEKPVPEEKKDEPPPEPVKKKKPKPPPDPTDVPKEIPKDEPKVDESKPVVGLDLDSTVKDGEGPSFATGNTRMGETDKVAQDPNAVGELQKTNEPPPQPQVVIVKPKVKKRVKPYFPERYLRMGIEGEVTVKVTIDCDGRPKHVEIIQASPHKEFNDAIRESAMMERFEPATKNGVPIEYALTYKYIFRLQDYN